MDKAKILEILRKIPEDLIINAYVIRSTHHGYAVIKEELDELWDEIICRGPARYMEDEAKQIGAMALRFLVDLC